MKILFTTTALLMSTMLAGMAAEENMEAGAEQGMGDVAEESVVVEAVEGIDANDHGALAEHHGAQAEHHSAQAEHHGNEAERLHTEAGEHEKLAEHHGTQAEHHGKLAAHHSAQTEGLVSGEMLSSEEMVSEIKEALLDESTPSVGGDEMGAEEEGAAVVAGEGAESGSLEEDSGGESGGEMSSEEVTQ